MILSDRYIHELLNRLDASHKKIQSLLKKLYKPKRYDLDPRLFDRENAEAFWSQKINGHFHVYTTFNLNWLKETIQERALTEPSLISAEHREILILVHFLKNGKTPSFLDLNNQEQEILELIRVSRYYPEREINEPLYAPNDDLIINDIHVITLEVRQLNTIAILQHLLKALLETDEAIRNYPLLDKKWLESKVRGTDCGGLSRYIENYTRQVYYRAFGTLPQVLWPKKVRLSWLVEDIRNFIINKQEKIIDNLIKQNKRFTKLNKQAERRRNRYFHQYDESKGFHNHPFSLSFFFYFILFGPIKGYFKERIRNEATLWQDVGFFLKINEVSQVLARYMQFFKRRNHPASEDNSKAILHRFSCYFKEAFDFSIKTLMLPIILSFPIIGCITLPFKLTKEWLRQRTSFKKLSHISMVLCDILAGTAELLFWSSLAWFLYAPLLSYQLSLIPSAILNEPITASIASLSAVIHFGALNCASAVGNRIALYFCLISGMQLGRAVASFLPSLFPTEYFSGYRDGIINLKAFKVGKYLFEKSKSLWIGMMPFPSESEHVVYPIIPIPEHVGLHNKSTVVETIFNGIKSETFYKHYPFGDQAKDLDLPNTFTARYKTFQMHGCHIEVDYISERHFKLSISSPCQLKI
ncbi:MAG: hypothetical protein U1E78_12990 [Gammaproteobacteria bacterium]